MRNGTFSSLLASPSHSATYLHFVSFCCSSSLPRFQRETLGFCENFASLASLAPAIDERASPGSAIAPFSQGELGEITATFGGVPFSLRPSCLCLSEGSASSMQGLRTPCTPRLGEHCKSIALPTSLSPLFLPFPCLPLACLAPANDKRSDPRVERHSFPFASIWQEFRHPRPTRPRIGRGMS